MIYAKKQNSGTFRRTDNMASFLKIIIFVVISICLFRRLKYLRNSNDYLRKKITIYLDKMIGVNFIGDDFLLFSGN